MVTAFNINICTQLLHDILVSKLVNTTFWRKNSKILRCIFVKFPYNIRILHHSFEFWSIIYFCDRNLILSNRMVWLTYNISQEFWLLDSWKLRIQAGFNKKCTQLVRKLRQTRFMNSVSLCSCWLIIWWECRIHHVTYRLTSFVSN